MLVFLMAACERPLPALEGLDLNQWKNDKNACGGKRSLMIEPLKNQKNKLQGLTEMQIIQLLGRPDQNELYKRNEKFYLYWLDPGKPCGKEDVPRKLSVRFNATGRAKEISVE